MRNKEVSFFYLRRVEPNIRRSPFRILHSPFRILHSAFKIIPHSAFRIPHSEVLLVLLLALLVSASCRSDATNRIVVYSTHGKELLGDLQKRFEGQNPGLDVQWLDMGSQDVLDRLRSEKANPQADVWFGAPNVMFSQASREGLLQSYLPTWADKVPASARGLNDAWFGTYFTPEVIGYNSNAVKDQDVPRDWDDLLLPRWRKRIIIRDPVASGTMRTIFGAMLFRFQKQGDVEKGFDWLRRLDANTKEYVANSTILFQKMARGEADITLWNMPDMELQRNIYHFPFGYVFPSSGTPYLTEGIALVRRERNSEAARKYYEFVTSEESLRMAAEKYARIPARADIPASSLPPNIARAREQIRPLDLDWEVLEKESKGWIKRWETEIRGSG
ncbi:MAG TPA: extracellular solute-binding protein [Acidobacteriota bacterium]